MLGERQHDHREGRLLGLVQPLVERGANDPVRRRPVRTERTGVGALAHVQLVALPHGDLRRRVGVVTGVALTTMTQHN